MKQCKRNKNNVKPYLISFSFTTQKGESGDGSLMLYSKSVTPLRVTELAESTKKSHNFKTIAIVGVTKLGL